MRRALACVAHWPGSQQCAACSSTLQQRQPQLQQHLQPLDYTATRPQLATLLSFLQHVFLLLSLQARLTPVVLLRLSWLPCCHTAVLPVILLSAAPPAFSRFLCPAASVPIPLSVLVPLTPPVLHSLLVRTAHGSVDNTALSCRTLRSRSWRLWLPATASGQRPGM